MQMPTADFNTGGKMQIQKFPTITENIPVIGSDIPTIGDKMNREPDPPPRTKGIKPKFLSSSEDTVRTTRPLQASIGFRRYKLRVSLLFFNSPALLYM